MAGPKPTVLDPAGRRGRFMLALGSIMFVAATGFLGILHGVIAPDQLVRADVAINRSLQDIRTPWADTIMVVFTSIGDTIVIVAVAAAAIGWMLWRRAWRFAAGLCAALIIAEAFVYLLKAALRLPRPENLYVGPDGYSFPSGHATMSATLFGILGWFIFATMSGPRRIVGLAAIGALVGVIATSRLYLSAHWPSDVAAGLLVGAGLAAGFGLAFRNADLKALRADGLIAIAATALLTVGTWHATTSYGANMATYARRVSDAGLSSPILLADGREELPQGGIDLDRKAREPSTIQ
jgi:membrane-associated phospholipid phosphatase